MAVQTTVQERHGLHPITFEVLRNAFTNICNEMGVTLAKVAYSPVIKEGKDFSGSIYTKDGYLVACGQQDLPGLLGSMEATMATVLQEFRPEDLYPGDVIFANIPHQGGTHLNDVRAIRPVFRDGELVAFAANLGHWTDVGGVSPGSINLLVTECYGEGLNISPVKVVERGVLRKDVLRLILTNLRIPFETRGDIHAQIKSLEVGEARLQNFFDKYGTDTVLRAFEAMFDYTEEILKKEIAALQDGAFSFEDRMDQDPLEPEKGPVVVRLTFTKQGNDLTFDFSESDPDPKAAMGCPRAFTVSGTYVAFLNLFPGIPFNHGVTRNFRVVTKPGTATHAVFPSSVSGAASGAFEKVLGTVFGAVGKADPARAVGCTCNLYNIIVGGHDPRFDRPFVCYVWNEGGYGGSPRGDGGNTPAIYPYASGSRNQPVEIHERWYPMLYRLVKINYQACGAGASRGGPGVIHGFELTHGQASFNVWGDRAKFPPWGVNGGLPGGGHMVWLNRGLPDERELGLYFSNQRLRMGDTIEIWAGGGGGCGHPFDRDPALVLDDVRQGIVDKRTAEEIYGVVVVGDDPTLKDCRIDEQATELIRRQRPTAEDLVLRLRNLQGVGR